MSGLCAAHELAKQDVACIVVEARGRAGGRIAVEHLEVSGSPPFSAAVDMGPSWFWPGQSHLAQLIEQLNLGSGVYPQHSQGLSVIEYANGAIEKAPGVASMAGSNRLDGGMQRLIDTLLEQMGDTCELRLNSQLISIAQNSQGVVSTLQRNGQQQTIESTCVIVAMPPRVVSHGVSFEPALTEQERVGLESIPTWMAAHAKCVVIYEQPFWRLQNLSGDAFSQLGPLVEIHDASPRAAEQHALFGFVGVEPLQRAGSLDAIKHAAIEQLVRLFGEAAAQPVAIHLKDWSLDPHTCTSLDIASAGGHVQRVSLPVSHQSSGVVWAGSETASVGGHANGYLEGAVESGVRAAHQVMAQLI